MDPETIEGILTTKALEQQTLNIALEKNLAAEEAGVKPIATDNLFETLTGVPKELRKELPPEFDPKAKIDEKERQRLADEAAVKALTSEEAKKKAEAAKKTEAEKQSKMVIKLPEVKKTPRKTSVVRKDIKLRRSSRNSLSRSTSTEEEEKEAEPENESEIEPEVEPEVDAQMLEELFGEKEEFFLPGEEDLEQWEKDILNNTAKKKDKTGNYIVMDQETRRCYANMMLLNKERTLSVTKELLDIVK